MHIQINGVVTLWRRRINNTFLPAIAMTTSLSLTGCIGWDLVDAQDQEPVGTAFDKALYQEFIALSESEFEEGDHLDAHRFARRAKLASEARPARPEALSRRDLPSNVVADLARARNRLVDTNYKGGRYKAAEESARAHAMFDCWMQEQEENNQPDDIARCRVAFFSALHKVEAAVAPEGPAALPSSLVVLLEDADGGVGMVKVSNAGTTRTLDRPRDAVGMFGEGAPPGERFYIENDEMREIFDSAMASQPYAQSEIMLSRTTAMSNKPSAANGYEFARCT